MVSWNEYLELPPEGKSKHMVCDICGKNFSGFIVNKGIEGLSFYCLEHWKELDEKEKRKS